MTEITHIEVDNYTRRDMNEYRLRIKLDNGRHVLVSTYLTIDFVADLRQEGELINELVKDIIEKLLVFTINNKTPELLRPEFIQKIKEAFERIETNTHRVTVDMMVSAAFDMESLIYNDMRQALIDYALGPPQRSEVPIIEPTRDLHAYENYGHDGMRDRNDYRYSSDKDALDMLETDMSKLLDETAYLDEVEDE